MSRSTGWSTAEVDFDQMALWEQRSLKGHWAYTHMGLTHGIISSVLEIERTVIVALYVPRTGETKLVSASDIVVDWDARRAWSKWMGPVEDTETFSTEK